MGAFRQIHSADANSRVLDWLRVYGGATVAVALVGVGLCLYSNRSIDWLVTYCGSMAGLLIAVATGQLMRKDHEKDPDA